MGENLSFRTKRVVDDKTLAPLYRDRLDLVILRSMAKKLHITLRTMEPPFESSQSLYYAFNERRGRLHRMIIYAPFELLDERPLHFVGFVSRRSRDVTPGVIAEIMRTDERMLNEIARVPGLLSYSSLELHPGNWYNLVVFRDGAVKTHVKSLDTHRYAAHSLSPSYYEWIRLHTGTMPGGLVRQELCLGGSTYYAFQSAEQRPAIREYVYDGCSGT
jgi:hypothetical protein